MSGFLRHTAQSIAERLGWDALRHTTLILPSQRAGLMLREELLRLQEQSGRQAVYAPNVQTLRQFLDQLSPLYAEDELKTIMRLYTLYCRHIATEQDRLPLDMFYGWGRQMIADFTNIDVSMHAGEVEPFFRHAVAAHELSEWQLDKDTEDRLRALVRPDSAPLSEDTQSVRNQYKTLWTRLYDLYRELHQQLLAERKGYEGMRSRSVVEHWEDIAPGLACKNFVFVGFNYLLPVEREVMELLKDRSLFYWDYVPDFAPNKKAFSFAQLNQSILGNAGEPNEWPAVKKVDIYSCSSSAAQAHYVHDWMRQAYTAKGQHVAVVICDEAMLEPVIYSLPTIRLGENAEAEPINITKGFPLKHTRAFARAMQLLDEMQQLDELETLADRLAQSDSEEILTDESWHGLLAQEALFQVRKSINRMRAMIAEYADIPFTVKLVRMLLRRQMENVTMPFNGEPVTDLQVLGVLETRVLDFDRVLLMNVEEGVLPQKSHDVSFIPFYLRKAYHMQTEDERATVYAYNFFRLLSRAGEVTMLYTDAEANKDSRGMSRFILQMLASDRFEVHKHQLVESAQVEQTEMLEETIEPFRRRSISPSAVNTYIDCPRKFYYQYIKHIHEPDDNDVLISKKDLGTFVHKMMQYIYGTLLGCDGTAKKQVLPEQIAAIRRSEARLQEALDYAYTDSAYQQEEHVLENEVILSYVDHILERDEQDAQKGLYICQLEQRYRLPLGRIDGVGEVYAEGVVDRLDITGPEGQEVMRVVDYKTGRYDKAKMSSGLEGLFEDPKKDYVRQTLIYSAAVGKKQSGSMPLQPNLFFCGKDMRGIETTIALDGEKVQDYKQVAQDVEEELAKCVQKIYEDDKFPQQGRTVKCSAYCPFLLLCGRQPDKED